MNNFPASAGPGQGTGKEVWSAEEARQHLAAQARSGLSLSAYCRQQGFSMQRLYWWRRKFGQTDVDTQAQGEALFIPVDITSPAGRPAPTASRPPRQASIDVHLRRGYRLRVRPGFDATTLQRLVTVLDKTPC